MNVPTLTLNETVKRFREAGIPTSEKKIGDGLEQKVYPFGICIIINGNRNFEIYENLLNDYLLARSDNAPPDSKIVINTPPNSPPSELDAEQIRAIVTEAEKLHEQKRNIAIKAITEEMIKILKAIP